MTSHFSMGAINKATDKYENPKWANKENNYMCPGCKRDVIFRKGQINRVHFAHKVSEHPCEYYDKPNEAQIHKDAKNALKAILESGAEITVERKCSENDCFKKDTFEIPKVSEKSNIVMEHRFIHRGNKIADVAYLENKEILVIFEILNTHATKEMDRTGEWFEFNAIDVINANDKLVFNCQRKLLCPKCQKHHNEAKARWEKETFEREQQNEKEKKAREAENERYCLEQIEKDKQREAEMERRRNEDMKRSLLDKERFQMERHQYEKDNKAENERRREINLMAKEDLRTVEQIAIQKADDRKENKAREIREERRKIMQGLKTFEDILDRERRDQLRIDNPDYDSDYALDFRIPVRT